MRNLNLQRRRTLGGLGSLGTLGAWAALPLLLAQPARAAGARIVSIGGAITETLFALGAQGDLVGVDTTSLYPEVAKKLPSVGYQRTLSAEGVLSLAPTLLLASEDAGPPAVLRQLEAAKLTVCILDSGHSLDGVLARTQRLAALCGRSAAGADLAESMRSDWQAARLRVAALAPPDPAKAPRVLFLMQPSLNQLRAAGRGTAADALIAYAGARNAFDAEGYKPLSPEAAMAAAPDVIITTDHGLAAAGGVASLLRVPGLAQTPAGRNQRVASVEILLALGFGPRLPLAVTTFAEAVHTRPGAKG